MKLQSKNLLNIAMLLILVQTWRVGGAVFLFELQKGNLPMVFAIPAGVGDILIGITAPMLFIILRKKGLVAVIAGLIWNVLGIIDLVYAVTIGILTPASYVTESYLVTIPTILVPTSMILHVITIVILSRNSLNMSITYQKREQIHD